MVALELCQPGLRDTMWDLICDGTGALLGAAVDWRAT